MTDIEKKALALLSEVRAERGRLTYSELSRETYDTEEALCRAIEQHEAFRREVSDAVEVHKIWLPTEVAKRSTLLDRFIIADPDPLVEIMAEVNDANDAKAAEQLRAALAKRGGKIVWENSDA